MAAPEKSKSLGYWTWDAVSSIRGANHAPQYSNYILFLIFAKRLCNVCPNKTNRIAKEVWSRAKAFQLVKHDKKLVRPYLPLLPEEPDQPGWSVIRKLSDKIGEGVTAHIRAVALDGRLVIRRPKPRPLMAYSARFFMIDKHEDPSSRNPRV